MTEMETLHVPADAATTDDEAQAVAVWLHSAYARSGSSRTVQAYGAAVERLRRWMGDRPLRSLTIPQAVGYALWLREESCMAPASQAQALAAARSLYTWWQRLGYVERNPFAAVRQSPAPQQLADRLVSLADLRAMLAVATATQRAVVLLLATTGLRVQEACGATWADTWVDVAGRTGLRVVGKGGRARDVKLLPAVVAALTAVRDAADEHLLPMRTRQAVDQMLGRLARRAGVRHVSAHCLRHAMATHALAGGAPLLQVQHDLGHASIATTQRYLHAAQGLAQTCADILGDLLEG